MVNVLFFGRLKEQLQCGQLTIKLDAPMTVNSLKQTIQDDNPEWREPLNNHQILVAVNQTMATMESLVNVNAEVAFFPPVTGG